MKWMSPLDPVSDDLGSLLEICRGLLRRTLHIRNAPPDERSEARALEALQYAELALNSLGPDDESADAAGVAERELARAVKRPRSVAPPPAEHPPASPDDGREALRGDSNCIALPDIIGFLQVQSKSGILRIQSEPEAFSLGFEEGDVVYAYSDNTPVGSRLAEILVQQGAIDAASLGAFLIGHSPHECRLGESLERESLVTREQISRALEAQVQHLFNRLFDCEATTFVFHEGSTEPTDETIRLSVLQLLLESARLHDEATGD